MPISKFTGLSINAAVPVLATFLMAMACGSQSVDDLLNSDDIEGLFGDDSKDESSKGQPSTEQTGPGKSAGEIKQTGGSGQGGGVIPGSPLPPVSPDGPGDGDPPDPIPNTAPTLSTIADQTLAENQGSPALAFTIGDAEDELDCLQSVSATTSDGAILDVDGVAFATSSAFGNGTANCTVTLQPESNTIGSVTVTLTVSDGELTASKDFNVVIDQQLVFDDGAYKLGDGSVLESCAAYNDSSSVTNPQDGLYWIDPDQQIGSNPAFKAQCDMTTDAGGWTLILNYLHEGGSNPNLDIKSSVTPLLGSGALGDDGSLETTTWGHASINLLSTFNFDTVRFYCETSAHSRKMHFKSSLPGVVSFVQSGSGSMTGLSTNFVSLAGHNANLPASSGIYYSSTGDAALTFYPFFEDGSNYWTIKANGSRWECDTNAGNSADDTLHRVWVK